LEQRARHATVLGVAGVSGGDVTARLPPAAPNGAAGPPRQLRVVEIPRSARVPAPSLATGAGTDGGPVGAGCGMDLARPGARLLARAWPPTNLSACAADLVSSAVARTGGTRGIGASLGSAGRQRRSRRRRARPACFERAGESPPPGPRRRHIGAARQGCMAMTDAQPDQCPQCTQFGFPIVPVRYAVARNDVSVRNKAPGLRAPYGEGVQQIALPEDTATYTLRLLRNGYLYVFNEAGDEWKAYQVDSYG